MFHLIYILYIVPKLLVMNNPCLIQTYEIKIQVKLLYACELVSFISSMGTGTHWAARLYFIYIFLAESLLKNLLISPPQSATHQSIPSWFILSFSDVIENQTFTQNLFKTTIFLILLLNTQTNSIFGYSIILKMIQVLLRV